MMRDRSRDIVQLGVYGLSAAMGACFGAAYGGAAVGFLGGMVGAMIGSVVGLVMSPALIIAVESSDHPLVLPYVFVPTLLTSLGVGLATGESLWTFLVPCAVYLTACLTVGSVFRERVVPPGHCRGCGYDMRGLTEPRCPECGWKRVVRKGGPTAEPPARRAELQTDVRRTRFRSTAPWRIRTMSRWSGRAK